MSLFDMSSLLFTWCVRPARVHGGEVDLFVLRGPSLCQNHLLSLSKWQHRNTSTNTPRSFLLSTSGLQEIGRLYFVLSVGHGAVKRPLLKLEVVHVQLLCEHAAWRHRDLGGEAVAHIYTKIYMHSVSLPDSESIFKCPKQICASSFFDITSVLFSWNSTHHSWVFNLLQCRYQCCGEDVCTWK